MVRRDGDDRIVLLAWLGQGFSIALRAGAVLACMMIVAMAAEKIPFFSSHPHRDRSAWNLSHGWTNGDRQSCKWRAESVTAPDGNVSLTLSAKAGQVRRTGCAEIQTEQSYGYGLYEARMRTAAGSGLNTAFFTYTGPPFGVPEHDEIDVMFIGKEPGSVGVNYHRNGVNKGPFRIDLGFDASAAFHDYAFEWSRARIRWFVDGKQVFETPAGADIPKNPGRIIFSLWSGSNMVKDWLDPFRYSKPVAADVAWVRFTPEPGQEQERGGE